MNLYYLSMTHLRTTFVCNGQVVANDADQAKSIMMGQFKEAVEDFIGNFVLPDNFWGQAIWSITEVRDPVVVRFSWEMEQKGK